ncbi:MAG: hypothetical protein IJV56_10185 [Neisseriaceae bacterium]|nr:hypothetical protein [Neisseriaceae bacterium]
MYYIYCRYLEPQEIAHYCRDKQCISVVHFYKGYSINDMPYARVYKGKIFFRLQAQMNNYAEFLMEDDIHISKKPVESKFIIYGSLPKMHGKVDNVEIRKAGGYIDRSSDNYIVSRDLKFRILY